MGLAVVVVVVGRWGWGGGNGAVEGGTPRNVKRERARSFYRLSPPRLRERAGVRGVLCALVCVCAHSPAPTLASHAKTNDNTSIDCWCGDESRSGHSAHLDTRVCMCVCVRVCARSRTIIYIGGSTSSVVVIYK